MTLTQAITAAQRKARHLQTEIFVVLDDDEGFDAVTEEDLDTYYAGSKVYQVALPSGEIE
jgi:hypothetical protein